MALRALLDEDPDPGEEQIRDTADGNYCRCTGYVKTPAQRPAGASPAQ
jgi:aerobic-type carbon monoxide dehydrogenase small subunit (CoxS/CutS family)